MVGVSGRSKGCLTCRRRKKGCDRQESTCGQCRKACIPCEGYDPQFKMLYYNGSRKASRVPPRLFEQKSLKADDTMTIKSSRTFCRVAYETGFEDLYWNLYLPNGQLSSLSDDVWKLLGGSLIIIRSLLPQSKLLQAAFGALALMAAHCERDTDPSLKEHGINLYLIALRHMGEALSSKSSNGVQMLGAARIFSFYEALFGGDLSCQPAQYHTWMAHQAGDLGIVLSKEPLFFSTGIAHRLFADGRIHYFLCAMKRRQQIPLSQPRWMTDPWVQHSKTPKDLLVDILSKFPGLYQEMDRLDYNKHLEKKGCDLSYLQATILGVLQELSVWKAMFGEFQSPPVVNWQYSQATGTSEIATAHVMTIYWAISILAHDAYEFIFSTPSGAIPVAPQECCRNILRYLPLFFHPTTGIFRQHLVPFPLITAIKYLTGVGTAGLEEEIEYLVETSARPKFMFMCHFISSLSGSTFLAACP